MNVKLLILAFILLAAVIYTVTSGGKTSGIAEVGGIGVLLDQVNGSYVILCPIETYPAHDAGLASGDEIARIDGEDTSNLSMAEVASRLRGSVHSRVTLTVFSPTSSVPSERAIIRGRIPIMPSNRGLSGGVGMGLEDNGTYPQVAVLYAGRAAEKAGLQIGDIILKVDGADAVDLDWPVLSELIMGGIAGSEIIGTSVNITVRRGDDVLGFKVERDIEPSRFWGAGIAYDIGPDALIVRSVLAFSPAEAGGMAAGDEIVAIDGIPAGSFLGGPIAYDLIEARNRLTSDAERNLTLAVRRNGVEEPFILNLTTALFQREMCNHER